VTLWGGFPVDDWQEARASWEKPPGWMSNRHFAAESSAEPAIMYPPSQPLNFFRTTN
jgi:hypothetical protein